MSRPAKGKAPVREPVSSPTIYDIVQESGGRRELGRLPALIARAFSVVRAAAPKQLALAGALQVAAALSLAGQLLVVRYVLNEVTRADGRPDLATLTPALIAFGLLMVVVAVASVAQREQQVILGEYVQKHTTGRVLDVSTRVDLIDYDRPAFHDRLQRARVNANIRPLQITNGVLGLLGSGAAVIAVGAALLWIEPLVVVLIVVGGIPSLFLNRLSSKLMHAFSVRQTPNDRKRAYLYQVLTRKEEAQEVRAFGSGEFLRDEHDRLYDERIVDLRSILRRRMLYGMVVGVTTAAVTLGAITMLLVFVRTGRVTVGDAAAALGAVILLAGRIRGLMGSTGSLYEGALFLKDFTDFVDIEQREPSATSPATVGENGEAPFDEIELDGVSFTYPSREKPSLTDISLSIRKGEVIALVGENGSGKTTLTKLLAGLYRPSAGTIRWDGKDVADIDPAVLQTHITLIFQDFARYFLPARENVAVSRLGDGDDLERVRGAARMAGVDSFLEELPLGYESLLGSSFVGGVDLSLGQWQRIALARAYFRDAPMLILDEPTASLDPRGEYEVFQQVRRLAEGRTVVLVSHRFSSVRAADRILVLKAGRIIEEGNHQALLAQEGLYSELFRLQAEGYSGSPT
ncbi:ABC transporter ATP-binding protein [soil metagenome]